jgi:hypothetical protein
MSNIQGKTTIVNEIDLEDLEKSEQESLEDAMFDAGEKVIFNLQTLIDENLERLDDDIEGLLEDENYDETCDEYHELVYQKESYEMIKNKFFQKQYTSDPNVRIENIKMFIKSRRVRLDRYLDRVGNTIVKGDLDGIEAKSKTKAFDTIVDLLDGSSNNDVSDSVSTKEIDKSIEKPSESVSDSASRLSDLLSKIENNESIVEEENQKELSEYEQADMKGKIDILYQRAIQKAEQKDGEPDGLIRSYIEDVYNPEDTILDDSNLYLNLLILTRMQEFDIMDWEFTDSITTADSDEYDTSRKWWTDIMTDTSLTEDERLVKIADKNFGFAFYSAMVTKMSQNMDRAKYSDTDFKLKRVLDDDDSITKEEHFLDMLIKRTEPNSVLMISDDMEEFIRIDDKAKEEFGHNDKIIFMGKCQNRNVYSVNSEEVKGMKGFKKGVIYINSGNSYVVNPTKPLAYFNTIENPFLKRPIIKLFSMGDFNFKMSATTIMFVDNLGDL